MQAYVDTFTPLSWEAELALSLRTADDLAREGYIGIDEKPSYEPLLQKYRFLLPRYYARLIDKADPRCPIRLQAIPSLSELENSPGFVRDPLSDFKHRPQSRITHRYQKRLLLHLTPNCSMYCRFCFRKSLLNEDRQDFFSGGIDESMVYLRQHTEVEEVIFSGGDPFLANPVQLNFVLDQLASMPQVQRIRFHTRVPTTFPMRVSGEFAKGLIRDGKLTIVVNHFNHPRELTQEARDALATLQAQKITLLNQSVLLAGINDSAELLAELSRGLFATGTIPYYLHHPDRSQGTAHFDLPMDRGMAIYNELRTELPGYLVPRYVKDTVDLPFKEDVENLL